MKGIDGKRAISALFDDENVWRSPWWRQVLLRFFCRNTQGSTSARNQLLGDKAIKKVLAETGKVKMPLPRRTIVYVPFLCSLSKGEDGKIVGECLSVGTVSQGDTEAEAIENLREAIAVAVGP